MQKYQKRIAEVVNTLYTGLEPVFTVPPDPSLGDLALPCFTFARTLKKSPAAIAGELKNILGNLEFIERMEATGGYLNFFIKKPVLFSDIINEVRSQGERYGSSMSGAGRKALVEHTSINPNASPHVGRARNALIGDAIVRLLRFEGFETEVHYFVNDVGKQIAMLLLGAMEKENVTFRDLLDIYIDINRRMEENPALEEEVFRLLYRLENGDGEIRRAFRRLVDICIKGQTEILAGLGIKYDTFVYESDYIFNNTTDCVLESLKKTGKLEEDDEGRLVLNLSDYNLPAKAPYLVLTRKDGTSLYPLRDIAYTIDKVKTGADINIIVLGEDQKLYFKQLCAALDLLGYKTPASVHYSFVLLSEGKMATRKGNVVLLEDFMKEAVSKASEEIVKRHGFTDRETAEAIGYGAVKYAILRVSNDKNVTFDWESALSFEGDSGPYLQYCLARINSIFRKYGRELPDDIDYSLLEDPRELELAKELAYFPEAVRAALREFSPHTIANHIYGLAKKFSTFYHDCPVLNAEDEGLKTARLALIDAVRRVILNGFHLLGIAPVDAM